MDDKRQNISTTQCPKNTLRAALDVSLTEVVFVTLNGKPQPH